MDNNIRAIPNNRRAFVRFVNLTNREVDIIWISFSGSYVNYRLLAGHDFVDVNTYKDHPWVAIDHRTKDRLHIEKEFVFYPLTTEEFLEQNYPDRINRQHIVAARIKAVITLPVYSLRYTSLLAVRNLLTDPQDVDLLGVPKNLAQDLKKLISDRNRQESPQLMKR